MDISKYHRFGVDSTCDSQHVAASSARMERGSGQQGDDIQVLGAETRYQLVSGHQVEERDWMAGHPKCDGLENHQIAHMGVMDAKSPFHIVRSDQSGTFMLACLEGSGLVLADGQWREVGAGEACLLPPFVTNMLRCTPGNRWRFVWVRYLESREITPVVTAHSPVFGKFEATPMSHAVEGIYHEACNRNDPSVLSLWIEVVQSYVMRFAQPHRHDKRLWKLWTTVASAPQRAWTLTELASEVSVSEEHLRRLCRKQLGRSPMQHVTFLRMQHAANLLATTDHTIETVAAAVGYRSPFTFSNTFLKWIGRRPSENRQKFRGW